MNTEVDDIVHRAALRSGFGLPQERLARMAAARTLLSMKLGHLTDGEPSIDTAFECIDAASAVEAPFVIGEDITI